MSKNKIRYIPIIIAVSIVAGIFIGTFYAKRFTDPRQQIGAIAPTSNKLNGLLRIINDQYVDTVNIKDLVEDVMPQVLGELDPHSSYIPAKDLQAVNEELKGSFSGIGIQFTIEQDTIHINNVIPGGPSEKVGLMPGDRIVEIDDSAFVGCNTKSLVIHGIRGSYAEQFAKEHNMKFDNIENKVVVPTVCDACGMKLKKDDKFCHECGAKVVAKPFVSIE